MLLLVFVVFLVSGKLFAQETDTIIIVDSQTKEKNQKKTFDEWIKKSFYFKGNLYFQAGHSYLSSSELLSEGAYGAATAVLGFEPLEFISLKLKGSVQAPCFFTFFPKPNDSWIEGKIHLRLNETYLKLSSPYSTMWVGFLVIPWSHSKSSKFLDVVNPAVLNSGARFDFVKDTSVPQPGIYFQTSILKANLDIAMLFSYFPGQIHFSAAKSRGFQIGRYQKSLVRQAEGQTSYINSFSLNTLQKPVEGLAPAIGFRLKAPVKDWFEFGGVFMWGFSHVPHFSFTEEMRSRIAKAYWSKDPIYLGSRCFNAELNKLPNCFGGLGAVDFKRTMSFGLDLRSNLQVLILKAEVLYRPLLGNEFGETTTLVAKKRMRSKSLSHLTAMIGADFELGDVLSGTLEVFDSMWFDVPENEWVLQIEPFQQKASANRTVHRLALAILLQSMLFNNWLKLDLMAEVGLLALDLNAEVALSHRFENIGLEMGLFCNVFLGVEGTPGWFRTKASSTGLYISQNF